MGTAYRGRSYFEDLDCLRTVLLVKVGGLRELRVADDLMADGLVEAENRKGCHHDWNFGGSEHWGANTTNGVKQRTSRDTDSYLAFSCFGNSSTKI